MESTLTTDGYLVIHGRVRGATEESARTIEIKRQDTNDGKDTSDAQTENGKQN